MQGKENSAEKVTVLVGGRFATKPLLPSSRPNSTDGKSIHLKTQGSVGFSLGESLHSSKSSLANNFNCRVFNNEPVTHQREGQERSETQTLQSEKTFAMDNISFAKKQGSLGQFSSEKVERDKSLSLQFRYRQLEFECASLKETLRSLEQREATEEQWRSNKLKEAHDKISELSRKLEQQSAQLHNEKLAKKKLETQLTRLNTNAEEHQRRLQQCLRQAEQQQHSERRAIEKLNISHREHIERLEAREHSISMEMENWKQKKQQLERDVDQARQCNSQLNTQLADLRCVQAKLAEEMAGIHQKHQVERENLLAQLNNVQAETVLIQAKTSSQFKTLRTDFDNAMNLLKVKDRTINDLTEKIQALQSSISKHLETYKHAKVSLQGKLTQLEQDYQQEAISSHQRHTGQRNELEMVARELAATVDALKHENAQLQADISQRQARFETEHAILIKQLTDCNAKLSAAEALLDKKCKELETLRRQRTQILRATEDVPSRAFHLQPPRPSPSATDLRLHRQSTSLNCRNTSSLERIRLLTEHTVGDIEVTKCQNTPIHRHSHHHHEPKLHNCASARHSIIRKEHSSSKRLKVDQEEETLNQAILRRCQLIIGERYGMETKRC